jgi:hypothetical protein
MRSVLSAIHDSLSHSRAAFALRVFVSYDALGRRKESVVVDIEPPRLPALLSYTPRHTIRILSPIAPLHPAPLRATPPSSPVIQHTPTISPIHPLSQSTRTALSSAGTSASLPSVHPTSTSLTSVRSRAALAAPSPSAVQQPSWLPPLLCPSPGPEPFFNFAASLSSQSTPLSSTVPPDTLALSSRGVQLDAADDEMGVRGDGGGSGSGSGSGSSATLNSSEFAGESKADSQVDSTESTDPVKLKRAQKKQKKKENKRQRKARRKERDELAVDDAEEEEKDGDNAAELRDSVILCQWQDLPAFLVADEQLNDEYVRRLAVVRQSGGFVSMGAFRQLSSLIDDDAELLEMSGQNWASVYRRVKTVKVRLVIPDDDLHLDDQDGSDYDEKTKE